MGQGPEAGPGPGAAPGSGAGARSGEVVHSQKARVEHMGGVVVERPMFFANQTQTDGKRHFECELKSSSGLFRDGNFLHNSEMERRDHMF